jgi:hypothetical protein
VTATTAMIPIVAYIAIFLYGANFRLPLLLVNVPRTTPVASSYYLKYPFGNWEPFLGIVEICYTTLLAYEIDDFITMVR